MQSLRQSAGFACATYSRYASAQSLARIRFNLGASTHKARVTVVHLFKTWVIFSRVRP